LIVLHHIPSNTSTGITW